MNIIGLIGQIFKPAADLIDSIHTSEEERLEKKALLLQLQADFMAKGMDYAKAELEQRAAIVMPEAKGESWLQRNWRPITMLVFLGLTVFDAFGVLPFRLAAEAWTLLQVGMGGYVVGRTVEKVAPDVVKAFRKDEDPKQ